MPEWEVIKTERSDKNKKWKVLHRSEEFKKIRLQGQKIRPVKWIIFNYMRTENEEFRCGWTIPKKTGSAVVRNRLKRWCREFLKSKSPKKKEEAKGEALKNPFPSLDLNIVVLGICGREFYKNLSHREFQYFLEKAWQGLQRKL